MTMFSNEIRFKVCILASVAFFKRWRNCLKRNIASCLRDTVSCLGYEFTKRFYLLIFVTCP